MLLNQRYCCYSYSSFAVKYKNTFEIEPAVSSVIGHLWNCRSVLFCCLSWLCLFVFVVVSLALSAALVRFRFRFRFTFTFRFTSLPLGSYLI